MCISYSFIAIPVICSNAVSTFSTDAFALLFLLLSHCPFLNDSCSTMPVIVNVPFSAFAFCINASNVKSIPLVPLPYTAKPFTTPILCFLGIVLIGNGWYLPVSSTQSKSFSLIVVLPSNIANDAADCTILTVSLPLEAYFAIFLQRAVTFSNPTFSIAFSAILTTESCFKLSK